MTDTSTMQKNPFVKIKGKENGLPALNTEALYALGLWVQQDERAAKKVSAWFDGLPAWGQQAWASITDDIRDADVQTPTVGDFMGALDAIDPVCSSAYCVAGNAVHSSPNYRILWRHGSAEQAVKIKPTGRLDDKGRMIYEDKGEAKDIDEVAEKILGLTDDEGNDLFYSENSVEYILARINGCCEARAIPLLFPEYRATDEHYDVWEIEDEDDDDDDLF